MAREYEADLQDAELEDEVDLNVYDNVFEVMEQSQPGVLRPEAKLALMRMDSGNYDYFGTELPTTPTTPQIPATANTSAAAPYSGLWDNNRLSTITEETAILSPETDNILAHKNSLEKRGFFISSSYDKKNGGSPDLV